MGYTLENMTKITKNGQNSDWGLKNNYKTETKVIFDIRSNKRTSPTLFIKIHPRQTWGNYYNFSFWFIDVFGIGN